MVLNCVVPGCTTKTRKGQIVSFHHLPIRSFERCKQWLRAIKHPKFGEDTDLENLKTRRICSRHFKQEDYEPNVLRMRRTTLKDTAVPSIFTFPDDDQPGPSGTKRIRRETPISPAGEEPFLLTSTPLKTPASVREQFPSPSVGFAHVACQTDPPTAPSCGSPLSKKTHTPPFRSTGGAVSCPDAGVDTAAVSASGPSRKRPRLDEEELNEGPRDVTNAPLHSLTATQSTDVKTDPSSRPTRCPSTSCMRAVSWSCSRCA
ncbi:THAP domain-containing protein 5-like isoform X1 [Pimephales promelas]|uniref:THAP domain-containing protein 5-like isoform X1 n=1 Tax=Pimephales promelas TaxID=90988 RepID=UPI0019557331|nr:THAP domain-containing protein 5-like isoform X1 [Pimephales promelas]